MPRSVAEVIADALVGVGVGRAFRSASRPSLGDFTAVAWARGLVLVDTNAVATAAVMAAVTGELSEAPGVLLVPAADAPAAVAGLRYAAVSRAPLLVISDGPAAVTPPLEHRVNITKESAADEIGSALRRCLDDPRGPVHIVLDDNVARAEAGLAGRAASSAPAGEAAAETPERLDEAARLLGGAERPVLVVGLGCRSGHVAPWLRALAEAVPMPVLATRKAKGVLPDPHPLMLGLLGDGGTLLARADLIVTVGLDPGEDVAAAWPPVVPRLHLGVAGYATTAPAGVCCLGGDAALLIAELAPRLRDRPRADWDVAELDRLKRAQRPRHASDTLTPSRAVEVVRGLMPAGAIATVEDGPNAPVVAAAWQAVGPNELLIGAGESDAPFAPAAALAAALARPGQGAVAFMTAAELAAADDALTTARHLGAPVVLIALGGGAAEARPTDVGAIATSARELERAVHRAGAAGGPTIIRVGIIEPCPS